MDEYRRTMSATTLIGDVVKNMQGEELGEVEEFMLDVETGRIAYVVVAHGGFLNVGDKLFAVPWEAFTLSEEEHALYLDVDKELFETAPGFDKDDWPEHAMHDWLVSVYDFYGYSPWW